MGDEIRLPRSGVVLRPVTDSPNCREFILGDWEMGLRRFGEGTVGVEFWTVKNAGGCYAGTEAGAIARLDSRVLELRAALMPADAAIRLEKELRPWLGIWAKEAQKDAINAILSALAGDVTPRPEPEPPQGGEETR